jgi:hypothetical protein
MYHTWCFCFTWSVHDLLVSFGAYMMFLFHLQRTWCFCFTWSVHDVSVSLGAYVMFLFHLERTWCFCFTWSVRNKQIMYASSETKTSCMLHVKQKYHVCSTWSKNIMYTPSETKTSCTLQVKQSHHVRVHDVFVSLRAYMMFLFHLKRTCFCFTWSVHDVFVSFGAYQVKQKHHVRSKWSKNMYASSETKTSCTL